MPLFAGSRLGPYEIVAPLGAGGMGEVYRARDTKLNREVAVKVLPETLADDRDRLARFSREAQMLAALNHPNIAHIYGVDESTGTPALVMELVEGPTLADRLANGKLPIHEALEIATQIADALEAAHEQGIVHRDLKPANIKVRDDGTVKILDFGLAKARDPVTTPGVNVTQSPTITTPALMTGVGTILGTAAYMSPEQAKGRPADKRSDIWAFGCVLYEMLAGRKTFSADTVPEMLASVLRADVDWSALPATTPTAMRTLLRRCLERDVKRRLRDIGDVKLLLEDTDTTRVSSTTAPLAVLSTRVGWTAAACVIMASGVIAGTLVWISMRPATPRVSRLQVTPSGLAALTISGIDRDLAITPDGSRLVYVGNRGTQLFVRALDALEPVPVFTGQPHGVFISPDGQWIGFADGIGVLKKVAVNGGPAVPLATVGARGGAIWGPDDTIIVATSNLTGLQRVALAGGPPTVLTQPDRAQGEADHFWPELLPGGRAVLFTITAATGGLDAAQVAVLDLQTGKRRILVRGGHHARYVPSGHLVYAAAGTLRAVPFDLARLETRGTPVPVVSDVVTTSLGAVDAVVAGDTLAYVSGSVAGTPRTLIWVDRQGREVPIPAPPRPYLLPALSPDGTRVAVFANDQDLDVWFWDVDRPTLTPFTFAPGIDAVPVWTPDGRRLIFSSERAGVPNLFWQAADGTGTAERLNESPTIQYPSAVSPDGRRLIFTEEGTKTLNDDVMAIELDGTHRITPLVQSPFGERNGIISPDGRWLAFEANDSGRFEIYVRPYPNVNSGRWQVSTAGGTRPLWTRTGQELVYVSPTSALMRVGVTRGPSWSATIPTLVVKEGYVTNPIWYGRSYDIAPDGQRFLMIKEETGGDQRATPASIVVVQHWLEELKARVPTNR
jgi:serine/threonine-protein kinase